MKRAFGITTLLTLVCLANAGWTIQSLTPHTHNNPSLTDRDTTWIRDTSKERIPDPDPDNPDFMMHQHRDTTALSDYADHVWDNNLFRNQQPDWGHGFQESHATYSFQAAVPQLARTDFNAAVNCWENLVNGTGINTNGVRIRMKIDFDPVATGGDFSVCWADLAEPALGSFEWENKANGGNKTCTFDSILQYVVEAPEPGKQVRLKGETSWSNSLSVTASWHYGGSGSLASDKVYYEKKNASGDIEEFYYKRYEVDFFSVALHELGHAWGLIDSGDASSLMSGTTTDGWVMRTPDAASIDHMKNLYAIPVTQPVPEPATLLGFGLPLLMIGLGKLKQIRK
jgi:hypothetical protein